MSTTVEDLIKKSLKMLIVAADEASVPAIESQDYIFTLNNLVAEMESDSNVDLTWTTVTSVSDVLACPDGIIRGLAALMATEMATEYGIIPDPHLSMMARDGMAKILRICTTRTASYKPATLPKGSGNEDSVLRNSRFYSGTE